METNEGEEIRWWETKDRPDGTEKIKKIEARSKEEVISLLKHNGIGGVRSHRHHDYSQAKKLIFKELFINSGIYDTQIGWICDYLRI